MAVPVLPVVAPFGVVVVGSFGIFWIGFQVYAWGWGVYLKGHGAQ